MANEITLSAFIQYLDQTGARGMLQVVDQLVDVTQQRFVRVKQNIGTTPEALILGDVSSLGWAMLVNRDPTNFVEILTGTGGVKFAKLFPRDDARPRDEANFALLHFGSGITAPFAQADTAACDVDVFIIGS